MTPVDKPVLSNGDAAGISKAIMAADEQCKGHVGDSIDHGLIFHRVLKERGYHIFVEKRISVL